MLPVPFYCLNYCCSPVRLCSQCLHSNWNGPSTIYCTATPVYLSLLTFKEQISIFFLQIVSRGCLPDQSNQYNVFWHLKKCHFMSNKTFLLLSEREELLNGPRDFYIFGSLTVARWRQKVCIRSQHERQRASIMPKPDQSPFECLDYPLFL